MSIVTAVTIQPFSTSHDFCHLLSDLLMFLGSQYCIQYECRIECSSLIRVHMLVVMKKINSEKCLCRRSKSRHFQDKNFSRIRVCQALDKSAYQKINFLISHPKHMLWVLKRTVSMRQFF